MTQRAKTLARVFAVPAGLAAVTLIALVAGLIGAERWRPLVWAAAMLPLVVAAICVRPGRPPAARPSNPARRR